MTPAMLRRSVVPAWLTAALAAAALAVAAPAAARDVIDLRAARADDGGMVAPYRDKAGQVRTTLDPRLQKAARRILGESRAPAGAVVVSDVRTGRILAWASLGREGDLVRRAVYPSASLFKLVTATALLEAHHVERGTVVCYAGGERKLLEEDVRPGCHPGDQRVAFGKALGRSINGVFARLAVAHLDHDDLVARARDLGLGVAPLVDVQADAGRVSIPADDEGDVAFGRAAAGFHTARISPLAALSMMQTVANGGERVRLHVLGDPDDVARVTEGRAMSAATARALVRMLQVTTRSGTSAEAFREIQGRPNVRVAGKTGTLATTSPSRLVSWFAGFAPSEHPEVAIAVLLANEPKWWRKANEVARDILDAHFERR
jgi:cell division protein FtsI/penicillin-binding protein 2